PPALGTNLNVAVTLSGRYIEFELPGMVTWHHKDRFGVSFEYLTARQTYGLALAIDVLGRKAQAGASAKPTHAARR
ncbi:MAG TPA: PilZ domain-containing protein, partial [Polyangiaceae bacterium]